MKAILQNQSLNLALIFGLFLLAQATDDTIKDALFKSLIVFAILNFIRIASKGEKTVSKGNSNLTNKS